ncbi:MAG: FmdB family transcriptional regulator [Opitutaceae bacterium]|nr:FmdB family transcriptional regulator [Opitutaceae bacterium]
MPIYEYYCPDNNKIYSFYAKTFAQGRTVPRCPDNPAYRMRKIISPFALTGRIRKSEARTPDAGKGETMPAGPGGDPAEEARMEAAMSAMEGEFANIDENDPRAMGRMMRRMSELTGEKLDGEMEEAVRKLEEGADPDKLEEQLGEAFGGGQDPDDPDGGEPGAGPKPAADPKEARHRFRARRGPPVRDPKLYDYE